VISVVNRARVTQLMPCRARCSTSAPKAPLYLPSVVPSWALLFSLCSHRSLWVIRLQLPRLYRALVLTLGSLWLEFWVSPNPLAFTFPDGSLHYQWSSQRLLISHLLGSTLWSTYTQKNFMKRAPKELISSLSNAPRLGVNFLNLSVLCCGQWPLRSH
jgi:hypothetical protein